MTISRLLIVGCALVGGPLLVSGWAQRGVDNRPGLARQTPAPESRTLTGKLLEIRTVLNDQAPGRFRTGSHLIVRASDGAALNVHLGPAAVVAEKLAKIQVGDEVTVIGYHTADLPENDYIAQSVTSGKVTLELRGADLRPVWAGNRGGGNRGAGPGPATDAAANPAAAPAAGRGCPWGGPGRGPGGGPPWKAERGAATTPAATSFEADRDTFHQLLADHTKIDRKVRLLDNGVNTVTESDDADIAAAIQEHAAAMKRRVEGGQPIHLRDPLFAALFGQAQKIKFTVTNTAKGVRVEETSDDPYVVKLIQAHADVVSKFVANGFTEARQNHAVPKP